MNGRGDWRTVGRTDMRPYIGQAGVPARVTRLYVAGALVWIILSNAALKFALQTPASRLWLDISRGLAFVVVSAGMIYWLQRRHPVQEATIRLELEESEERFAATATHYPYSFAIYDAERRFSYVNPQGLLAKQMSVNQVLGRRDEEVFPIELVNAYLPTLKRALETRRRQSQVVEHQTKAGQINLIYTFLPLLRTDGTVREVLALTHDISSMVQMEQRLRQLNRTLSVTTSADSVLMRATDEASLLRDFCAVLAAQMEPRLIWVGFVEGAEQLRVVEHAGKVTGSYFGLPPDGGVVMRTEFPLADAVIRTRQPCICRDLETDQQFASVRQRVRSAGLRSAAALPLRDDGKIFGVLCLYSGEAQCFADEEVKLLVVLADDLAYCLVALRQRQELVQLTGRLRAMRCTENTPQVTS